MHILNASRAFGGGYLNGYTSKNTGQSFGSAQGMVESLSKFKVSF